MNKLIQLSTDVAGLWAKYGHSYLGGIRNTLILAIVATAIGCLIGLICGILQTIPCSRRDSGLKRFFLGLVRVIVRIYVEVFRGTPMILQAVFIYFGLPYFTNNQMQFSNIWSVSILVVSINTGAYMAESVRGGILSVDVGQTEGAKAIGMNHVQTMTAVVLPQALRNIMPQIGNNLIINIKDTSVMFIIGFSEFFATHKGVVGATFQYFPSAAVEMAGYLCMTLIASFLLRWLEKRMDGSGSYELVQTDALTMSDGTYNYPGSGSPYDEHSKEYRHSPKSILKSRKSASRGERGDE
jgi:putative lysine transport system permease protein